MNNLRYSVFYGIATAMGLIIYFLLVRILGLHENPWLRIFNGAIMASGIYYVIKNLKHDRGLDFEYFDGFKTAIATGFLATMIFSLFMGIYMFHLDLAFTEKILGMWRTEYFQSGGILLVILLIEGFSSSLVLSLAFMQLFKKSLNIVQNER